MPTNRHREPAAAHTGGAWPGASRRLLGPTCHRWIWLTVLASLGFAGPAKAEGPERWRRNPGVGLLDNVTLRIRWFESTAELREASAANGQQINETGLRGFSILKRNKETGAYVCEVYVVKMVGAQLDGDHTMTFGHEVLHCFGLQHE
jgi:hypothetical protein